MKAILFLSIFVISVLSRSYVFCEEDETEEIVEYIFDSSQNDVQDHDVSEDDSDVTSTIVTLEGKFKICDFRLSNFNLEHFILRTSKS